MKATKLQNLRKAFQQLAEFSAIKSPTKVEQAGIIHAFEYTFELFWKVFKELGNDQGLIVNSPKQALKAAFQLGFIENEGLWDGMLKDRNETVHVYNETLAQQIHQRIVAQHLPAMVVAMAKLSSL